MSRVIVDTNVAVVANSRQEDTVDAVCLSSCIAFIARIPTEYVIVIDDGDEVRREYTKALSTSKPHGLGALFIIHVLQNQYNPNRVELIALPKSPSGEFLDFPTDEALATFDKSDRKFAALARKTGIPVTNATDSDWIDHKAALNNNGIRVEFLCGCDRQRWFTR